MITRRRLLAASSVLVAAPAADHVAAQPPASRDAALLQAFDAIAARLKGAGKDAPRAAAEGAMELKAFDPVGLSPVRRWSLAAVREGLAMEGAAQPGYAAALSRAWGGQIDPRAAHQQAVAAAAVLQARADALLKGQGLAFDSVAERLRMLARNERFLYPDDDHGRQWAAADMNARLVWIRPRLAAALGDLPVAQAEVRRMSPADEAARRPGRREPPRAGQPGAYFVDLANIRARPSWTLASVAFHEVTPGHLLQIPLQEATAVHPLRLRYSAAYSEAWGTYAEELAASLGAYARDPLGEIGYLQWRLFRVARIVADTGLGVMGWSRDQAVAEMTRLQGQSIAFITIEEDVGRMAATPGAAAAQGLGALALTRWRPARRSAWPAYHRTVLANGPWPMALLEKMVRA